MGVWLGRATAVDDPGGGTTGRRAFFIAFSLYTVIAVALLAAGLFAVVIESSERVHTWVESWPGWAAAGVLEAAGHTHGGGRTVVDFIISVVSLGLGLIIVWLRPDNWTARFVAVGAIGTAAAFNLESHSVFFALSQQGAPAAVANALHMGLHALSGAAYLHAFLSFPDGRLGAPWMRRTVAVVWVLAVIETVGAAVNLQYGIGPLGSIAHRILLAFSDAGAYWAADSDVIASLASGDALFFVAFFGLFIPAISVVAQAHRYRTAATAEARQQARMLAWALSGAFGIGLVFFGVAVILGVQAPNPQEFFHQVESVLFRVFAPLFSIIPLALLVGVVRYRLWSVDDIVRHVLVYTALTVSLILSYVAAVVFFGLLLRPIASGLAGDLVLVLSTLVVAALFLPMYRRLRAGIDARFRRFAPDPASSLGDLEDRIDGQRDVETVRFEVLASLYTLFEPRHLSMWVHEDDPSREP